MDKYEFNIKVEQIKKLMKKKDFITAVKIADTIDWDKVKDNQLLIMVADVYEIAGRYDAARDALLTAYERTGLGRQLAYRLCRLSVKRGDINEAQEFYEEFTENSPRDAGRYILQYEMAKGSGQSIPKQIEILETYIEADMDDKWAYELAKLYHKAQMSDKCVELCDTIILWFADGKYVEKALELKQLYVPLSEHQRLKYEAQKSRKVEVASGSTTKIIEEAVQKVIEQESEPPVEEITAGDTTIYIVPPMEEEKKPEKPELELYRDEVPDGEILDEVHEMDFDINNVHFKDYSVHNKYDTVNIQKELAQSVSSLFDDTGELFRPIPRHATEPVEDKEDDQITGQMNLEEVLAMFEAGEFSKKEEVSEEEEVLGDTEIEEISMEVAEEVVPEVVEEEIEELEDIEDESYGEESVDDEDEEEEFDEFEVEADIEDNSEEIEELPVDESSDIEESLDVEEASEEEIVADIIANEIIFDVTEEIEEQRAEEIEEAQEEIEELIEEASEELEEQSEEEAVEEETVEEETVEEETVEEDSEVAESEIQERETIMFDLKEDLEEEVVQEPDETEEEPEGENTTDEPAPAPAPIKKQIVPSETAKEELKKFIARFTGVQGLDKQILKVMQNTFKGDDAPVKFIFVKGEVKSGKTTLAIDVLKLANKMMQRRDQKIAKIKAESINGKSIDALLGKLEGSDVLIEKVSDMRPETFAEFIDKLKEEGADRFVIFEDEKHLADEFLEKVPEAYREFANVLDIKQNKIKDWTKMASDYAKSKGYAFDEMGILALSAKIDQLRAITLVVHKNHVEQVVDGAIKKANKFSIGKIFGRQKNEEGLKLLTEKDFID